MLDLVVVDGHAKGIIVRDLVTGEITRHAADAVVLATGGYGNVFNLSTYARGSNATAIWRAYKRGACFANPCFTQIHPTCIPVTGDYQSKLTLMSESLRNDGRIWVPKKEGGPPQAAGVDPEEDRDYYLERIYPSFGNLCPRDVASRAAKRVCDEGRGVGESGLGVYLDFADAIGAWARPACASATATSSTSTTRSPTRTPTRCPMRIFPAVHYTMGGLWVDYNLMSNVPGLFVLGEANFSDHGANRLGASALMQGLADGYFVLPYTIGDYLATQKPGSRPSPDGAEFRQAEENVRAITARLLASKGRSPSAISTSAWATSCGSIAAWRATGPAWSRRCRRSRRCARSSGANVNVPGSGTRSTSRSSGGPGGRFSRARRAHVPRRPRARGELRRPFPRGAPVSRRRMQARRRQLRPRGRLGIPGEGQGAAAQRRAARLRVVKMSVRNYK
jgi:succinate dehydrogenase / fumarate reductase, flavoprotein subunit